MKVMVIGGGGREHALVQALKVSPEISRLYVLPGNGGMEQDGICVPIGAKDLDGIVRFAQEEGIEFAVVAPDDPLVLGAVDRLEALGIPCFGPNRAAAVIEGSKAFAKELMEKYHIPTAGYRMFTDMAEALSYLQTLSFPAVIKADGLALGVDAVAISYVQTADDVREAKKLIADAGRNVPVVVKLERQSAVDNLDEILEETDIIMVARGDLGVECPLPQLPALQKRIIRACNSVSKPVIVATQMLLSMVNSPVPTRAETTDVANAVLDGADCVMMSEETAMGNFPVETVRYMRRITDEAEKLLLERRARAEEPAAEKGIPEYLAYSACLLADKAHASAIVAHSVSGASARLLSSCRPSQDIYALTPDPDTIKRMNFSWGVVPVAVEDPRAVANHLDRAENFIARCDAIGPGESAVITAGQRTGSSKATPRGTNLVKIYWK